LGEFDTAIERLNRRRAALDAEITALPKDDPQRIKLRSKLRKLDAQIEALEETDEDELTEKDRRMARQIAEELNNIQQEAGKALEGKEGESKEGESKEGESKEGENKEGENKEGENKEGEIKEDSDPAPEHSWFRERGRKR
jgi:hypothetical protein